MVGSLLRSVLAVWLCIIFVESRHYKTPCGLKSCSRGGVCRDDRCVCLGVIDRFGYCAPPAIVLPPPTPITLFPRVCTSQCSSDRVCKNGVCVCKSGREVFGKCVCPHCTPDQYCQNGECVCRTGNLHNGKCVVCTFPEVYKACPSNCPPTCEDNSDDPIQCTKECNLSNFCVCAEGYVRKSRTDSACVRKEECGKSSVCTLDKDTGPCEAAILSFYYNRNTQRCENFYYGGCEGNANRFQTVSACRAQCERPIDPCSLKFCPFGMGCKEGQCVRHCRPGYC